MAGLFGGGLKAIGSVADAMLGNPVRASQAWGRYNARQAQEAAEKARLEQTMKSLNLSPEEQILAATGASGVQAMIAARQKQAAESGERQYRSEIAERMDLGPRERLQYVENPTNWATVRPSAINGKDGIYQFDPNSPDDLTSLHAYPEEKPEVSPGWIENPDGSWTPKKGGPHDPEYIRRTAGVRRDVLVDNPMPRVGGGGRGAAGGSGGGKSSGLPPGFVLE